MYFVLTVILSAALISGYGEDHLVTAQKLFQAGKFTEAEGEFRQALSTKEQSFEALRGLGILAVLGNRLDSAEKWLLQAAALRPDEPITKAYLAETYYRRRDFARAAPLFRALGAEQAAAKLESFGTATPYQIDGSAELTSLPLVNVDPLPVITARINNGDEVNLLVDTGGGELILDPEFAKTAGAREFGSGQGRIDALKLGDFTVRNIPISILDTQRFAPAAGGRKIEGIIGTVLFYQFVTTLDYPNRQLILERRSNHKPEDNGVPFWMAGDHFMIAWGKVSGVSELLFVDTGLAGAGFTCPESTLKEIGVDVPRDNSGKAAPFTVNELTLANASEERIRSLFGPFPPALETRFGFRIGGLVSHAFLKNYAVTFDFDTMQLRLKRP